MTGNGIAPIFLCVLLALLFTTIFAFADDQGQQVCKLKGTIRVQAPMQIFCMKDLEIDSGTRIITDGNPLQITAVGAIKFGDNHAGLKIYSFTSPAPQSHAAGPIYIYAHDAYGSLEIFNRGASDKDLAGEVFIEYITRAKSYFQSITVTPGTRVELTVNGFDVPVSGLKTPDGAPTKTADAQTPEATNPPKPPPKPRKPRPSRPRPPRQQQLQPSLWGQPQIFQWRW